MTPASGKFYVQTSLIPTMNIVFVYLSRVPLSAHKTVKLTLNINLVVV